MAPWNGYSVAACLVLLVHEALSIRPRCRDAEGKPVEWFLMYKLPKKCTDKRSSFVTTGYEMAYVDANTNKDATGWKLLNGTIAKKRRNPVAQTIANLYDGKVPKTSLYVVYNDQPPAQFNGTAKGHTKGIVEFSKTEGYWLLHSVPAFPENVFSSIYEYPTSGVNNGQVFMCISLPYKELPKVAAALRQQYPYIYRKDSPATLTKNSQVYDLMRKAFVRKPNPRLLQETLQGVNGTEFVSFAKHQSLDAEVYATEIAPRLDTDLLVETWRNGAGGKLPPSCPLKRKLHTVTNLANVVIRLDDGRQVIFKTTEDHAKWAVSDDASKPWFCDGSLNRMASQNKRGGQTMCFKNDLVFRLFTESVEKCQTCGGNLAERKYCKENVDV